MDRGSPVDRGLEGRVSARHAVTGQNRLETGRFPVGTGPDEDVIGLRMAAQGERVDLAFPGRRATEPQNHAYRAREGGLTAVDLLHGKAERFEVQVAHALPDFSCRLPGARLKLSTPPVSDILGASARSRPAWAPMK